jgi:hypothetical protein
LFCKFLFYFFTATAVTSCGVSSFIKKEKISLDDEVTQCGILLAFVDLKYKRKKIIR